MCILNIVRIRGILFVDETQDLCSTYFSSIFPCLNRALGKIDIVLLEVVSRHPNHIQYHDNKKSLCYNYFYFFRQIVHVRQTQSFRLKICALMDRKCCS